MASSILSVENEEKLTWFLVQFDALFNRIYIIVWAQGV